MKSYCCLYQALLLCILCNHTGFLFFLFVLYCLFTSLSQLIVHSCFIFVTSPSQCLLSDECFFREGFFVIVFVFFGTCRKQCFSSFFKSGIDKSTEWSTIPACPSLMCFLTGAIPKGLLLRKICVQRFMYVLFYVNLCQD